MCKRIAVVLWLPAIWLVSGAISRANEPVDYERQIKPILHERCYACHGALKQEASLRLDTAALAIRGGDSGAAIVPGQTSDSLLLTRVAAQDIAERMPPEGEPLTVVQVEALTAWIAQGALAPADEQPERDPGEHWAFQTPVRPAVPPLHTPNDAVGPATGNPIDAFIMAELQRQGLQPQGPADKRVWLRRVYLDLIGLPPTRDELDQFVSDDSADAYETVVTRLLDSPQYGERWGRHWMDVWRYSDWWGLGAEVRNSQKHIWHWRDWIIESLNADKGYDQMLREMLAADELYPQDLDRLRGTGFLARQYFKFNRTSWLDETVEHVSKAMLGLTFNCSKCHDHKYDPISHEDYYRLRAIFEPYQIRTDLVAGEIDYERNGIPRAFDCNLDAPTYLHLRGDDRNPDKGRMIEPAVPSFLSHAAWKIEPVALPAEAHQPGLREHVVESHLQAAQQKIVDAKATLQTAHKQLLATEAADELAANPAASATSSTTTAAAISDDFKTERPDVWESRTGSRTYTGDRLVQTSSGGERGVLRLKQLPPADFEAKLKFRTMGGAMWKSVGITFDVEEPFECLAYLSAYAGGPKSQLAYKTGDNYTYPPGAAQSRSVELNQPYEMTLRVRDTLINVLIDGELSIAYRLPVARRRGALELITFDASAEFLTFELRELPEDVPLTEAKSGSKPTDAPPNREQALLAVTLAEKTLAAADAQPAAIRARAAAAHSRSQQTANDVATELAREAVRLERLLTLARAEEEAARAELDLARAASDKRAEAEKKLAATRSAIEAARQSVATPDENFTPLSGAWKTLESNLETEASRSRPFPATSTGRRSALANWLTDARNPLPARVAVNHIWLRHMGQPLVPTVFDFGRKGTPPTHPELLDWLAVELIEHGWSMKHVHRLIVTSQAYRRTSSSAGADADTLARDRDNRYYWRANPLRMEAQVVRDSLLHLAGELDLTRGGPSIPVNDANSRRRSLYFVHSHNEHQQFLSMFDDANVLDCYRRTTSIVPQQALALENSALATSTAEKIVERIVASMPEMSDREFVLAAFLTVLAVEPTPAELTLALEGVGQLVAAARQNQRPQPEVAGRVGLIHALLNHNDFVTIR